MKSIIYLAILLVFCATAYSQYPTKAPFKGKVIDKEITIKYVRMDGSEFTKYNNGHDWFQTKEATGDYKMKVSKCFKKGEPTQIIYKKMNGEAFSTRDRKNWVAYNENSDQNATNSNILEITKYPTNPLSTEFLIEFNLKEEQSVTLLISDIKGNVVYNSTKPMATGGNQFQLNVAKYQKGSYTYKITAGNSTYDGVFVKM